MTPGAIISKYGYYVIGVTVGGNAITACTHDDAIRFCDHTGWYDEGMCWAAKDDYEERPYSPDNVKGAQIVLSTTRAKFLNAVRISGIYALIEDYD